MAKTRRRTDKPKEFQEAVLEVKRVMRVVKGGRRLRFRALIAIGNKKGKIAIGLGKAGEVAEAIRKAGNQARKQLTIVPVTKTGTIPHKILVKNLASKLLLMPANVGTGIIAGGVVRQILVLAGLQDVLSKTYGSLNKANMAKATIIALSKLQGEYEFVPQEAAVRKNEDRKTAEPRRAKSRVNANTREKDAGKPAGNAKQAENISDKSDNADQKAPAKIAVTAEADTAVGVAAGVAAPTESVKTEEIVTS